LKKKIIKSNLKKTLFFSSSIIFSTLFGILYLVTQTECKNLQSDLKTYSINKNKYSDKIKSLRRKRIQLIQSIENTALTDYDLIVPDPEPIIVYMGNQK